MSDIHKFVKKATAAFPLLDQGERELILGHFQFVQNMRESPYPVPTPVASQETPAFPNKGKEKMYDIVGPKPDSETGNLILDSREHFTSRLYNLRGQRNNALEKDYGLEDEEAPRTANELIDRIKSGRFVVQKDKADENYWNPIGFFRWRDPEKKKDHKGFDKASKKLQEVYREAEDLLFAASDGAGFHKALKHFQDAKT